MALIAMPVADPVFADWDMDAMEERGELYENAIQWIEAGRYDDALNALHVANKLVPGDPDTLNLLGFSYRKTNDLENSAKFYEQALKIRPHHKGALEYQGELFIRLGQVSRALENLAHLERLCPEGCKELSGLQVALSDL